MAKALIMMFPDLHTVRDTLAVGTKKAALDDWFAQSGLDVERKETEAATLNLPSNSHELDELVGFGEAGWLAHWVAPERLVLTQ